MVTDLNSGSAICGELAQVVKNPIIAGKFSLPSKSSKLLSRMVGSLSACAVTSTGLRGAANGTQDSTCFWESSASGVSSTPSSSAASAISTPAPPDIVMTARRREAGNRPRVQA